MRAFFLVPKTTSGWIQNDDQNIDHAVHQSQSLHIPLSGFDISFDNVRKF